jgi:hypothetical protein
MSDRNVISDIRTAKTWVDAQARSLTELGEHLRSIEQAYQTRTGEFASVPMKRPQAVQAAIDAAVDEPGQDLLNDLRSPS